MESQNGYSNLKNLIQTVEKLRSPEGCPWDREQNHKSLRKYLLNESYELLDAIDDLDYKLMCEELGDVLLQVVLHAQIAKESEEFDIEDVAKKINEKLIRRHPHVFANTIVKDADEVVYNWEQIKCQEKPERVSILDGIPASSPALLRAEAISKKAVSAGFEWPDITMLWDTFYSEIEEFKQAAAEKDIDKMSGELGDILFTLVNIARWHKIAPELALQETNKKFISRFHLMEKNTPLNLSQLSQPELEELWQNAKIELEKRKKND
jgi:tetrapyrrole methylase family protein/MazG family protein